MQKKKRSMGKTPSVSRLTLITSSTSTYEIASPSAEPSLEGISRKGRRLSQWSEEWIIFKSNCGIFILGCLFQYFDAIATNVAYFLHTAREPVPDLGHWVLPYFDWLGFVCDIFLVSCLILTMCFTFSSLFCCWTCPTIGLSSYHATVAAARFVTVLIFSQCLRIVTFLFTTIPGPNVHCRPDSRDYNPPKTFMDVFTPGFQSGCGDLVFSYPTMLLILCAFTVQKYGYNVHFKRVMWLCALLIGPLSVAARRNYSVDVVVAWYGVPLLWMAYDISFPDKLPSSLEKNDEEDELLTVDIEENGALLV